MNGGQDNVFEVWGHLPRKTGILPATNGYFLPLGSIRSIGICHPIKSSINGYCFVPKSRIDQVTESAGEIGEILAKK